MLRFRLPLLLLAVLASAPLPAQTRTSRVPVDRATRWRQDLDSAATAFLTRDRSFSPEGRIAFEMEIAHLRDSVAEMEDPVITMRLAQAVARAGNAHTRLYLVRNRTAVRRYPVRLWWFGGGLHVVRARAEHRDLLGARVIRIAGLTPGEAAARVGPLYAGNASWHRYLSTYTLTSPETLQGLGILRGDSLELEVLARDGRTVRTRLAPLPLEPTDQPTEAWWDLSPRHPGRGGPWESLLAADSAALPLYLRNPTLNYWFEYLPGPRILYVGYPRSQDQPGGESTAAFGDRLMSRIEQEQPDRLVIDLRFNTGGNLDLAEGLIRRIAALPLAQEPGRLFVITGRATFSAGLYHAALLRQLTRATLVGEPVGDDLDFWAEGGNLVLPNSRLTLHFADRFHGYSPREYADRRPFVRDLSVASMAPDILAEATFRDYVQLRDPVMEAVLRYRPRR